MAGVSEGSGVNVSVGEGVIGNKKGASGRFELPAPKSGWEVCVGRGGATIASAASIWIKPAPA
jgi:hypothetical protein